MMRKILKIKFEIKIVTQRIKKKKNSHKAHIHTSAPASLKYKVTNPHSQGILKVGKTKKLSYRYGI